MQFKNLSGGQELICINVDKVYDWIVKEKSFDISLSDTIITFTPSGSVPDGTIEGATVRCEVTPDEVTPIEILDRVDRPFIIDGAQVTLQQLNIRKNFIVTIIVTLADGTVLTSATPVIDGVNAQLIFSRCEQVTLCAPEGTDVEITYTDLDCFVCTTGTLTGDAEDDTITFSALTISVVTCQSIQSIFPVTVEFLAEFCEPRDDLPTECPAPIRPLQCPAVFPNFG